MFYQNPNNYTLSLIGMYNYDNTLFDNIAIPDGMDKDALINTILARCGENEVRYANTPLLKTMISVFFKTNEYRFTELWNSMHYDYDPLENYNITHERTYTRSETGKRTVNSEQNANGTAENMVSGYNTSGYSPQDKTDSNGSTTSEGTEDNTLEITETTSSNERGDNSARSAMYAIKEQRDIVDFNIYSIIASDFEDDITIPVYTKARSSLYTG